MSSRDRRWTFLVVLHGSGSPREFYLSHRSVRALASLASAVGLLALIGLGFGMSTLGAHLGGRDDQSLREHVLALQARLDSLQDTIEVIGHRDEQIRLLAGLPEDSTTLQSARRDEAAAGGVGDGPMALGVATDVDTLIKRANTLAASFAEVSDTLARAADRYARVPSIMPTAGWLSSNFSRSRFHPILHINRPHEGIDVSAPMGAPIVAPAAGVITRVGRETGYGLILEIDHGNGIVTKFAHCSRIDVRAGQRVKRGQPIAAVGNSGLSTGPHLHYEIHVNGRLVDPLTYVLPGDAIPE